MQLCENGCGQKATHQFKNSKWCCSNIPMKCPINGQKTAKGLKKYYKDTPDALEKNRENVRNFYKKETKVEKIKRIKFQKQSHSSYKYRKKIKIYNRPTIEEIQKQYPIFAIEEEMRYNPDKPGEKEIQVHCKNHHCKNSKEQGGWFTPSLIQRSNRLASLDRYGEGNGYMYCSEECKQACDLYGKRVSQLMIVDNDCKFPYTQLEYKTWRDEVFKRAKNKCEYCGELAEEAHHSKPQKLYPGLALDPDYGIACCKKCHHKKGHTDKECTYGYIAKQ